MEQQLNYLHLARELGLRGRVSGNELYARCPLHSDQTPSFSMHIYSGRWTCHMGCGPETGRDFTKLVMSIYGITALAAEQWIASRGQGKDNAQLHERILELLPRAQDLPPFCDSSYFDGLSADVMPISFLQRGFSWETIQRWDIRYDPDIERVVIPVYDHQLMYAGWVARSVNGHKLKYLNSPELDRDGILFGGGFALALSRQNPQLGAGAILLTEGPLDAIYAQQCGLPAAAVFGSSLSDRQLMLLRNWQIGEITLGLDCDPAGMVAAIKIWRRLVNAGFLMTRIRWLRYPAPAKDPNECTREELWDAWGRREMPLWS